MNLLVQVELQKHRRQKLEDWIKCSVSIYRRGISLIFPSLLSLKWWPKVIKGIKFLSRIGTSVSWRFQIQVPVWSRRTTILTLDVHFKNLQEFSEWAKILNTDCCKFNFFQPFRTGHCSKARRGFKTSCSNSWNVLKILHRSRRKISFSLSIRIAWMRSSYHCARMSEKQHFLFLTATQHAG